MMLVLLVVWLVALCAATIFAFFVLLSTLKIDLFSLLFSRGNFYWKINVLLG